MKGTALNRSKTLHLNTFKYKIKNKMSKHISLYDIFISSLSKRTYSTVSFRYDQHSENSKRQWISYLSGHTVPHEGKSAIFQRKREWERKKDAEDEK